MPSFASRSPFASSDSPSGPGPGLNSPLARPRRSFAAYPQRRQIGEKGQGLNLESDGVSGLLVGRELGEDVEGGLDVAGVDGGAEEEGLHDGRHVAAAAQVVEPRQPYHLLPLPPVRARERREAEPGP